MNARTRTALQAPQIWPNIRHRQGVRPAFRAAPSPRSPLEVQRAPEILVSLEDPVARSAHPDPHARPFRPSRLHPQDLWARSRRAGRAGRCPLWDHQRRQRQGPLQIPEILEPQESLAVLQRHTGALSDR
jgi:hypothetical protein